VEKDKDSFLTALQRKILRHNFAQALLPRPIHSNLPVLKETGDENAL
jgi:hypothetical protein